MLVGGVLVEADFGSNVSHVQRRQNPAFGNAHRMKFSVQFALPKIQELVQHRKFRGHVQFLPNESLKQTRMIGHVIEDFGCSKPIAFEHQIELAHDLLPHLKNQTYETHFWVRGSDSRVVDNVTQIRKAIVRTRLRRRRGDPCRQSGERSRFLRDSVSPATVFSLTSAHHDGVPIEAA